MENPDSGSEKATSGGAGPPPPPAPPPVGATPSPSGDAFEGLVPYRNPKALAAYYLAVFSLIPGLGLLLGGLALVLGILRLRLTRAQRQVRGGTHAWVGIILGGLCFLANLFVLVMLLVATLAGPRA